MCVPKVKIDRNEIRGSKSTNENMFVYCYDAKLQRIELWALGLTDQCSASEL